jgi:hypothetical protein
VCAACSPETEKETRFGGKEFPERRIFKNAQEEFQERITVMTLQNVSAHFLTVFLRKKFHVIIYLVITGNTPQKFSENNKRLFCTIVCFNKRYRGRKT